MNQYISIIEYKNKKILYANHQNTLPDFIISTIKQTEDLVIKMDNPELLLLVDVRNCELPDEVIEQFKITAQRIKDCRKKTAVLGVTGIRKILLIAINKFSGIEAKAFDREEEAKEWLVSEI